MRTCTSGRNIMNHTPQWVMGDKSNWKTNTRTPSSSKWCLVPSLYSHCSTASAIVVVWISAHRGLGLGTIRYFNFQKGSRPLDHLTSGRKWLCKPCILGGPQRQARGENQNWVPHPCLLRGPKRGWNCYVTPVFLGDPNAKRGEKIRLGSLTPAFAEAHMWGRIVM